MAAVCAAERLEWSRLWEGYSCTEQRQAALLIAKVRSQGSAALRFKFAARRWLTDGSPITGEVLKEDSVYWIAVSGRAREPDIAVEERCGLDGQTAIGEAEGGVLVVQAREAQESPGTGVKSDSSGARSGLVGCACGGRQAGSARLRAGY